MTNTRNSIDSSRTRISQEQGQENNYYNQHDNNNHARARAREGSPEQMAMIAKAYRANVAKNITPVVAHMIEDAMAAGMDCDTIIWACEETGLAPNPSPRYLRAVLRNWSLRGHVSSRVHAQEKHIEAAPWYALPEGEYLAASVANGENPDEWWCLE